MEQILPMLFGFLLGGFVCYLIVYKVIDDQMQKFTSHFVERFEFLEEDIKEVQESIQSYERAIMGSQEEEDEDDPYGLFRSEN